MKALMLFVLLLMLSPQLQAAEVLNNETEVKQLTENVMQKVSENLWKEALLLLRPYSLNPVAEFDSEVGQVELQIPVINQRFGSAINYDFVKREAVGDSLLRYVYLQKFEKHVMSWHFIFYKPKDVWQLDAWSFDDNVESLFQ